MKFNEQINAYIEELNCTAKELADAAGLSAAVISRYRTGEREPGQESEQLLKLVSGIARIAAEKGISHLTTEKTLSILQNSLNQKTEDYATFITNYDKLIDVLEISMKSLSAATNFDISYLYRIRSGQRRPNDLNAFCNSFCRFVASHHNTPSAKAKVAALRGCTAGDILRDTDYLSRLREWLYHGSYESTPDYMENFLKKLDEFNLEEYIRAIRFDELKVPSMPFRLPVSKTYYGIKEMRKGELDFFKTTVLSKSQEPVFMCSDMPMEDMAEDMDFNKKWMFAIAMSLKKGLHLNIIHNIDRPFQEMMLEVPLVKDTIPQLTLTRYCRKQLLDKYKEALSTSPLKMATVLLYFFGTRISNRQSRFVCPRDRKTRGNPKGGATPLFGTRTLLAKSSVLYPLSAGL